jgi:ABC-2 type transport system permease protein
MTRVAWAFVRRDWLTALSYRLPFVLDVFSLVVNLTLFFYIGRLVAPDAFRVEGGYFAFAAVGISFIHVFEASLATLAMRIRDEQSTGTLEVLITMPLRPASLVVGLTAYEMLRATGMAIVTLLIAVVLFDVNLDLSAATPLALLVVLPAAVVLFGAIGVVVAGFTVVFKQAMGILAAVTVTISLFSGVYFPVGVLPEPLETIAGLLPLTWALDVLRAALLGGNVDELRCGLLVVSALVAAPLSMVIFEKALDRARRDGSLTQY